MQFRKYTKEQFIQAVKENYSIRAVLEQLNVKPAGGNYAVARKYIEELGLDTSHFKGQGWSKGKKTGPKRPIEDYLTNKCSITSYKLKLRLIAEGYKEHKCECCGLTEWQGKPISLHLDHINGIHQDNSLDNLQILCPNCHSQTSTYAGKNWGSYQNH